MTQRSFRRWCHSAILAVVLTGSLASGTTASAEEGYSEDAVKAAFLSRFAEYVDWPPEALTAPTFTIAVVGADGVAANLQRLLPGYPIKNLPAQVRKIRSVQESTQAQILYVGAGHGDALREAVAMVGARPILLVTDEERSLDAGGAVNFVLVDQRVRFEVSLPAAQRSGLTISSKLLSVAIRVETGHRSSRTSCVDQGLPESHGLACALRGLVSLSRGPEKSPGSMP